MWSIDIPWNELLWSIICFHCMENTSSSCNDEEHFRLLRLTMNLSHLKLVRFLDNDFQLGVFPQHRLSHLCDPLGFFLVWCHLPVWHIWAEERARGVSTVRMMAIKIKKMLSWLSCSVVLHSIQTKHKKVASLVKAGVYPVVIMFRLYVELKFVLYAVFKPHPSHFTHSVLNENYRIHCSDAVTKSFLCGKCLDGVLKFVM